MLIEKRVNIYKDELSITSAFLSLPQTLFLYCVKINLWKSTREKSISNVKKECESGSGEMHWYLRKLRQKSVYLSEIHAAFCKMILNVDI